jgi:inner membrane protein
MIEQFEKQTKWYQESILVKLGIITLLILLLLIPSSWIQDLITDRQGYQKDVMRHTSNQWSDSQQVRGPVLLLPYKKQVSETSTGNKTISKEIIDYIYVLPHIINIKADVKTEKFQKGVYDATVYNSKIQLTGSFNQPELSKLGISENQVMYDKARVAFSISDLKGLKNNPVLKIQGQSYNAEPVSDWPKVFEKSLQANFASPTTGTIAFSYNLDLRGSNELNFLHIGKTTTVEVKSDWKSPEFNGRYLPDTRTINESGFSAKWNMLDYNRPYPQQWVGDDNLLTSEAAIKEAYFGVKLQLPIDGYRKITRTAKYSTLIILLTFVSLLLTELIRKQRIHIFNYTLIGAAMVVYYTLLLSFAEQIGYNYAYLLSSVATITLIAVFTASLFNNTKAAVLFAFILTVFYGFIFIIIQLEEFSLMVGSIALFIIIAALMYFSRKINWDKH